MTQPDNNQSFYDRNGLPVDMTQTQQYADPQYHAQPYQASPYQAPQFQQPVPQLSRGPVQQKSWLTTLLLCLFLGYLGIHNFYTGRTGRGIAQLIMEVVGAFFIFTILGFGIGVALWIAVGIWVLVEFIMIITGSGGYDRDVHGVPLHR